MKPIALFLAAAVAAILTATATASPAAVVPPQHAIPAPSPWTFQPKIMPAMPKLYPPVWVSQIERARDATWRCQRQAELERSRPGLTVAELRRGGYGFRGWALTRWQQRLDRCETELARTLAPTNDWLTAVRTVQRAYPGSEWWLVACSSSEGGHGGWVYFGHYRDPIYGAWDTPGGPMQYKQGTFWHDFNRGSADLRARGFRVPASAASWYSMLGQAIAAGWAYNHARWGGKWTGDRC